jgi:nitroimidazol reductase NimA-like FMN-containing flavoprotein (pyridoxamine 5'-phosphate oxidase superfamily)
MNPTPTAEIDKRFSDSDADPTPWADVLSALECAELYWITTVRSDGRPHVTPLVGVVEEGAAHFCTGVTEQKFRNLERNARVALTTGNNSWDSGLDVVVEGTAVRIADNDALQDVADAYEAKYGSVWHFDVKDGAFDQGRGPAHVFRVEPAKVFAFAKDPHAQTRYRFPTG